MKQRAKNGGNDEYFTKVEVATRRIVTGKQIGRAHV